MRRKELDTVITVRTPFEFGFVENVTRCDPASDFCYKECRFLDEEINHCHAHNKHISDVYMERERLERTYDIVKEAIKNADQ